MLYGPGSIKCGSVLSSRPVLPRGVDEKVSATNSMLATSESFYGYIICVVPLSVALWRRRCHAAGIRLAQSLHLCSADLKSVQRRRFAAALELTDHFTKVRMCLFPVRIMAAKTSIL